MTFVALAQLLAASLIVGCSGTEPQTTLRLTGEWTALIEPNPFQIQWSMSLLEDSETGEITGTSIEVRAPAMGGTAHYWVEGTHHHPQISLYFDTGTFTPGPSFNGEMVHPDTLRGTGESSGVTFHRR